jgi:hypothetical protein
VTEGSSTPTPSVLVRIWGGMLVIDVTGRLIGSVKYVKHAAPGVAPITDRPNADEDLDTAFARALTEADPHIGTQLAEELVRQGFVKVAGAGPMDNDLYVLAGQIAEADEDTVHLSVSVGELTIESERWF